MADEIVTIRIDFKTNKKDMAAALAQMKGLDKVVDDLGDSNEKLTGKTNKMKKAFSDMDEPLAAMNRRMQQLTVGGRRFERNMSIGQKAMLKFQKAARLVFFALVALVGEFVITAATLASVNLAFKAGQWALKAYNVSLGLVGAALASIVAGVTVAIAAFREYQAALVAFQYKGANVYGSAIGASSAAMRTLTTDTNLATMGVQQLTQAYTSMARSAKVTAVQSKALSGAMDFLAGAEDQGKSFQAMANFVGLLTKNKKVTSEVSAAASGVSKEFAKAVAGQKDKSAGGILASMASGDLAAAAGLKGGFDALKTTVVAQFKQYTTFLARDFSDFGEFILNDLKEVMNSYFKTIRNTFAKLTPEFMAFARGPLFKSLISIGNAIGKFSIVLMRKYLPMLEGGAAWVKRTFASFQKSFNQFRDSLEKFRRGSEILTDAFGEPLLAIFRIFGRNAEQLGYLAEDNEQQFLNWGKSLETLIFAIGDFFAELKVAFTEALPVLTAVVNALAKIISFMGNIIGQVGRFNLFGGGMNGGEGPSGTVGAGMGPGIGSLLTLGLMFGAYKGRRFAYRDRYYSTKDPASMASAYATKNTPRGFGERLFGSAPRMFTPSYWRGTGGSTANEYAASMAFSDKRTAVGRDAMMGQYVGGLGPDKILRDPVTGQRIGFRNVGDYRNYMASDPRAVATVQGMRDARALANMETGLRGAGFSNAEINRRLNAKALEQIERNEAQRALAFGGPGVGSLFRDDQSRGRVASLKAFGGRDYGERMKAMTKMRTKQGQALNRAYKEFVATEKAGRGRFQEGDAKSYRAFARAHAKANIGGRFAGVGEAAQASMRGMFNPMMGLLGGMVLSSGVTGKIGDADFRKGAENALGLGAMFGTRGMLIAGGAGLMGSTSTGKAALGGAMAGLAVGKTVSDMLAPVFGPAGPMAKAAILAGSALVGGIVGAFRAQGNRERTASKIGKDVGNRLVGRAVATMLGAGVDPQTGRIVKRGPGGFRAMEAQLRKDREALMGAGLPSYSYSAGVRNAKPGDAQRYILSQGDQQVAFIDRLYKMGVMSKEEYDAMKKIAGDRSNNANKTRQALIDTLGKDYLGYNKSTGAINDPSMLAAEQFFTGGVRGKLSIPENMVLGRGQVADIMAKRGQFVVNQLVALTGKTEQEIMQLASKLNVNLADPMKNLTGIVGELGMVTRKTVAEMNIAIRDLAVEALTVFDKEIAKRQSMQAVDASYNALVQAGSAASLEDFADFARTQQQFFAMNMADDPMAYMQALKDFSEGKFQSGDMSAATLAAFKKSGAQEQAITAYNTLRSGVSKLGAQQFTGALLESNAVFANAGAGTALQSAISSIISSDQYSSQEKKILLEGLSTGNFVKRNGKSMSIDTDRIAQLGGAGRALATYITSRSEVGDAGRRGSDLFALETSAVYQIEGTVEIMKGSITEIGNAIATAFDRREEIYENAPAWWNQMLNSKWEWKDGKLTISGDTRSSRRGAIGDTTTSRALRGTMAAHSRFNSMLTGKRSVTSSLRFDNLGSMSSDHAAGRAYDLVGQNLGQYQQLVAKAGGFAEFHGRGGSRHLHVVPPIGGTRTSRAGGVNPEAASGMTQNVTVNVYGAAGQSETVIAKQVVATLAEYERSYRERS